MFFSFKGFIFHFACLTSHVSWFMFPGLGPGIPPIYLQPGGAQDLGVTSESPWKVIKCQASLQGNKSHENCSQSHRTSWSMVPGIVRNAISAKVDFAIHPLPNAWLSNPRKPDSNPKSTGKATWTHVKMHFLNPNLSEKLSTLLPRIIKNR